MRICVVQTQPIRGNILRNVDRHKELIELACSQAADVVVFPELSLTGYEPELADDLAVDLDDSRFDEFQTISDGWRITIGVGVPTRSVAGISISMLLFQPHQTRRVYSKKYLHVDEEPFFVSGASFANLDVCETKIALAICYELSIPEHVETAVRSGATVYLTSVAKSAAGVDQASRRLADIAKQYSMTVLMSNSVGPCDNFLSAGRSAVWNRQGVLVGELDDTSEGVLIFDTATEETQEAFAGGNQ